MLFGDKKPLRVKYRGKCYVVSDWNSMVTPEPVIAPRALSRSSGPRFAVGSNRQPYGVTNCCCPSLLVSFKAMAGPRAVI